MVPVKALLYEVCKRAATKLGLEWPTSESNQGAAKSLYDVRRVATRRPLSSSCLSSLTLSLASCLIPQYCCGGPQAVDVERYTPPFITGDPHSKCTEHRSGPAVQGNPLYGEWRLHPQVVKQIWQKYRQAAEDLFASQANTQCPMFFSLVSDDAPLGIDALACHGRMCFFTCFLPSV